MGSTNPFPLYVESVTSNAAPPISSLLIKPASAVCNLDCSYCFYLDRDADPYKALPTRRMTLETLERLVDSYLFYSYPNSVFAFQGGEPTLAGLPFFEKLVQFQQQHGRHAQSVSNAMQTNAMLLDKNWCEFFRSYQWLLGVSLDGPEEAHDLYRYNKDGHGTWKRVMESVALLKKHAFENVEARRIRDDTPTPDDYKTKSFHSLDDLRAFKREGALLLMATKPDLRTPAPGYTIY